VPFRHVQRVCGSIDGRGGEDGGRTAASDTGALGLPGCERQRAGMILLAGREPRRPNAPVSSLGQLYAKAACSDDEPARCAQGTARNSEGGRCDWMCVCGMPGAQAMDRGRGGLTSSFVRLQDARGTDDRTLALMRLAGQSRETSPVECGSVVLCEPGVGLAAAPAASCLTLAYTVHRRQRHGEPHPQRDVAGARLHRIDRHRARASAHRSHMRCNASSITLLLCRAQRPAGASEPAPAPAPAAACKRGRWQTPNTPCKGHAAMHEVQLSP
jgi:hypothetical protein